MYAILKKIGETHCVCGGGNVFGIWPIVSFCLVSALVNNFDFCASRLYTAPGG